MQYYPNSDFPVVQPSAFKRVHFQRVPMSELSELPNILQMEAWAMPDMNLGSQFNSVQNQRHLTKSALASIWNGNITIT